MQIVHFASVPNYLFTQHHFLFNSLDTTRWFLLQENQIKQKWIKELKCEISKYDDECVWISQDNSTIHDHH